MKKLSLIICMCALTIFAAGCNDDNEAQKNTKPNDNQTTENENKNNTATDNNVGTTNNEGTTNTSTNKSDYSFREFDLEVVYDTNKEYEASYESEKNGVEASIEDDLKNERMKGNEAVDQLDPILKKLDIDANTSEEDVISKVVSAFDLDDNYQAINVDITFNDGTEKEYTNIK